MKVHFEHFYWVVVGSVGIEQSLACAGVGGGSALGVGGVEGRVDVDHVARHLVSPFKDLRPDVDEKDVGGPTPKYHDFVNWVVRDE